MDIKYEFVPKCVEIFISSTCNLDCQYCYISKNKAFFELDKLIVESLQTKKYFNIIKDFYGDKKDKLERIELWGGEPTLHLDLFTNLLDDFMGNFKNLNAFFMSTNFTTDVNNIKKFLKELSKYNKKIMVEIQISLDGPENVTTFNRGKNYNEGVNNKIEQNLVELLKYYNEEDLKDVGLRISMKPTLVPDNVRYHLKDIEETKNYFLYFQNLVYKCYNLCDKPNFRIGYSPIPNFCNPGEYTTDDGKVFAEYVKNVENLKEINLQTKEIPLYVVFNFLEDKVKNALKIYKGNNIDFGLGFCGAYTYKTFISPEGKINICHRGFLDYYSDYREGSVQESDLHTRKVFSTKDSLLKNVKEKTTIDAFDYNEEYSKKINVLYNNSRFQVSSIMSLIYELSLCGQVSKIYSEDEELLAKAAIFARVSTPCLYDNIITTGSLYLKDSSLIRLYFNGAFEYLIDKYEEK